MSMADKLNQVADRLEKGWCQNTWFKDNNDARVLCSEMHNAEKCCIEGAVIIECGPKDHAEIGQLLASSLGFKSTHGYWIKLSGWNDAEHRTKEEVVSMVRRTAEKAKENEDDTG